MGFTSPYRCLQLSFRQISGLLSTALNLSIVVSVLNLIITLSSIVDKYSRRDSNPQISIRSTVFFSIRLPEQYARQGSNLHSVPQKDTAYPLGYGSKVRVVRFELTRYFYPRILSPMCLPFHHTRLSGQLQWYRGIAPRFPLYKEGDLSSQSNTLAYKNGSPLFCRFNEFLASSVQGLVKCFILGSVATRHQKECYNKTKHIKFLDLQSKPSSLKLLFVLKWTQGESNSKHPCGFSTVTASSTTCP